MGENDFTNDTVENDFSDIEKDIPTEDSLTGNTEPSDAVVSADISESEPEENIDASEPSESDEIAEDGDGSSENEADDVLEQKDHKADLDGYRAYRRRTVQQDENAKSAEKKVSSKKFTDIKFGSISIYAIVLALFTLLDFFVVHIFASNQSYNVSDKILSALGFDALHFTNITYSQICLGLGYFVAFLLGGIVLFILMKILNKLFENFPIGKIGGAYPAIVLGIFTIVFIVGFAIAYFSNDALLIPAVYRWGAPAAAYLGGLMFYGASKLHVGIEY
ncbi:MAG: hypothetical protein E7384_03450 [Ruminococcaceae bacterium]|nr:hypothetical protein [Oscillospiraceae bacterium]